MIKVVFIYQEKRLPIRFAAYSIDEVPEYLERLKELAKKVTNESEEFWLNCTYEVYEDYED